MIACKKCYKEFDDSKPCPDLHLHHIIPKCLGGTDKDGRIYLCKTCHDIIAGKLLKIVWEQVSISNREILKKKIKSYTHWWIEH